jgi:TolA-binding protein
MLGVGKSAFARSRFDEAEQWYERVVQTYPETEAAPEALYWAGVSRYKATNDAGALQQTARNFQERYTDTSWAKKASVWG